MNDGRHIPVLLDAVVTAMGPLDGALIIDGTYGLGGYTRAFLTSGAARVFAIDRDPTAIARAKADPALDQARTTVIEGCFGAMESLLAPFGPPAIQGIALDLGVSSPQIDTPERGFSFRFDGPLDMRMSRTGPSAADIVNRMDEGDLADILYQFGEERLSRRIARAILLARAEMPIDRTQRLAEIVRAVVPPSRDGIDPATRTFQALRIYVNDELGEVTRALGAAERLLAPGGRLAVVSFHSLEDRIVKTFLRMRAGAMPGQSRHLPLASAAPAPSFRLIGRKPILADAAELSQNPRARSAKLRIAERTDAAPWPTAVRSEEIAA